MSPKYYKLICNNLGKDSKFFYRDDGCGDRCLICLAGPPDFYHNSIKYPYNTGWTVEALKPRYSKITEITEEELFIGML